MESAELFYKIDPKKLETKSKLKGVYFTKPRLVALYDLNYGVVKPASKMFYFKKPNLKHYPIDLNEGYGTYTLRKENLISNALQCTLEYAMSPKAQMNTDNIDAIKVFTRRGTLVDLMNNYYGKKYFKGITILASRYNGDLYMVHKEDMQLLKTYQPKHTHHEQLLRNLFAESPYSEPKADEPIDENIRLMGVHQSIFGKFKMIYHGEIQGVEAKKEVEDLDDFKILNNCHFVAAKQMWHYVKRDHHKYFTYWLQAYLANILDIYFAYKDKDGMVHQPIVHKLTSSLPKEFKWNVGIYTEFLYEFLQRVNDLLEKDNVNSLSTVYEFKFDCEAKAFTYKIFKENSDKIFITQEYMEYCKQL